MSAMAQPWAVSSASAAGHWAVSYASNHDWDDGKKSLGSLVFWSSTNWLLLLDDKGNPVFGWILENGEVIHLNSIVRFPSHMALVLKCFSSLWGLNEPSPLRWNAVCSSFVKGEWSPNRPAFLILRRSAKRMILLDHEEVIIDARFLLENEEIKPGFTLDMPVHKVVVGSEISESKTPKVSSDIPNPSSASSLSLNFDKGVSFKKDILDKFGSSVAFQPGFRKREFILVISFGRTSFKLDIHMVGLVLQACFGDPAAKFRVNYLRERTFRFSVDSRAVGFQIYNAGKVVDPIFEFQICL
jgi:hypothetical protein